MQQQDQQTLYPAKLMLFGEYAVVKGGSGLIIPFHKYHASWDFPDNNVAGDDPRKTESNRNLFQYHKWLAENTTRRIKNNLNLAAFAKDLERGMYLNSDIPHSYGTGSSGAVVAAVYNRYAIHPVPATEQNLSLLKSIFSEMEAYFHGKSSGLDPLCVYTDSAVLIRPNGKLQTISQPGIHPEYPLYPFLLDSGTHANTHPLVEYFLKNLEEKSYSHKVNRVFNKLNDLVISRVMHQGFSSDIVDLLQKLSAVEADIFSRMIPERITPWWERGLISREYTLKLLGSGGGGYILGFTPHPERTTKLFRSTGLTIIEIFKYIENR